MSQCMLGCHTPEQTTPLLEQTPTRADTPLPETATAADGMHPTGMHSCCQLNLKSNDLIDPVKPTT